MKQIATVRVTQVAAKLGDHAPATVVCCNACRTCITTNIVGIATAAVGGLLVAFQRVVRRDHDGNDA